MLYKKLMGDGALQRDFLFQENEGKSKKNS